MLGLSIPDVAYRNTSSLSARVNALFRGGEQGVWYDPSDRTTLYQDADGITPVTTMEQPVGLMLDKSKGLTLGPELVNRATQTTQNCTAVANGAGWNITATASGAGVVQSNTLQENKTYLVTVTWSGNNEERFLAAELMGITYGIPGSMVDSGTVTMRLLSGAVSSNIKFRTTGGASGDTLYMEIVSIRELHGNHCTFKAGTGRPVLSARYNLYVGTETLATQNVTTAATNYKLTFTGTGTITLSGTATGTYSAGTHTITCTAGTLTSTVSGTVTKADFRDANDGIGLPAYQRVGVSAVYDTAGFPAYLRADGTDDGGSTNSIDFTGTDKITVFAGVRKLSDADAAILCEFGTRATSINGSFALFAPSAPRPDYGFASRGSAVANASSVSGQPAPGTHVVTGRGDIYGDSVILRVNGTQTKSSTADQGTGNYGNYPLFLFARNNASNYFNGRLYGLIVLGRAATEAEIANTERYLNQKGRLY